MAGDGAEHVRHDSWGGMSRCLAGLPTGATTMIRTLGDYGWMASARRLSVDTSGCVCRHLMTRVGVALTGAEMWPCLSGSQMRCISREMGSLMEIQ